MDKTYDVIVVGAGPAGSMAALKAAEGGAKTLLLEKHEKIGEPVCCAEGITVMGLERVIKARPEWISAKIEGARFIGPSGKSVCILHPEAGIVLDRSVFDSDLAKLAVNAGAEIQTCAPVVDLKMNQAGAVNSLLVDNHGSKNKFSATVIIAADGVESRVAQMAGIDTTLSLHEIDSACQYLAGDVDFDEGIISLYIGNSIAPGGYAWIFPKSKNTANIGLAIYPSKADGKTAKEYLDLFMAERFPGYKHLKTMMGIVPAFNPGIPMVKGNLMLTGDAARVLDSLSGAGISNALISGSIAGETAAAFLTNETELKEYPRQFMKLKSRELYAYKLFRSLFVKVLDSDFDKIIDAIDDFFPEKKIRNINVPDTIFKLVLKNPGLLGLARYLITQ
jgi:digeranylgeranylglycerophospholipid reductase